MARSRIFKNNTGAAWTISELGGLIIPSGSPGSLDVTDLVSDMEIIRAVQNNGLTLSADHYLTTELEDITSSALIGNSAILDYTQTGGTGAENKAVLYDGSGNLNLGAGKASTSAVSFSGNEIPNATWIEALVATASFKGNVISPYFKGDVAADPGAVGAGVTYIDTSNWSGFGAGHIVERNAADDGWTDLKAAAVDDQLILLDSPVGDFVAGEDYSIIKLTDVSDPYLFTKIASAADGMYTIVSEANSQFDNNFVIYDTTGKWTTHELVTSITAGTGLSKSGTDMRIGATGATGDVNGINRTADDIGAAVKVAAAPAATGAIIIEANQLAAKTDDDSLQVNAANAIELKKVTVTLGQREVFSFSDDGNVKNQALYHGQVRSSDAGARMFRNCKVTAVSCQLSASGTCDVHLKKRDGAGGAWATLLDDAVQVAADYGNQATGLSAALSAGEELRVDIENVANVRNPIVEVEVEFTA